ncbi:hypothetical protein G7046_g9499 [Stylonectria norvegica]|nr:hypothetical protein G7046_g9499 [Stylonectria norvegica]
MGTENEPRRARLASCVLRMRVRLCVASGLMSMLRWLAGWLMEVVVMVSPVTAVAVSLYPSLSLSLPLSLSLSPSLPTCCSLSLYASLHVSLSSTSPHLTSLYLAPNSIVLIPIPASPRKRVPPWDTRLEVSSSFNRCCDTTSRACLTHLGAPLHHGRTISSGRLLLVSRRLSPIHCIIKDPPYLHLSRCSDPLAAPPLAAPLHHMVSRSLRYPHSPFRYLNCASPPSSLLRLSPPSLFPLPDSGDTYRPVSTPAFPGSPPALPFPTHIPTLYALYSVCLETLLEKLLDTLPPCCRPRPAASPSACSGRSLACLSARPQRRNHCVRLPVAAVNGKMGLFDRRMPGFQGRGSLQ